VLLGVEPAGLERGDLDLDLPVDEVAHVLDVSSSTVKQHLHRARGRLADLLSEATEEVSGDVD
jgi:RNA polymerase sigma-70 factor (ECF subfamily)